MKPDPQVQVLLQQLNSGNLPLMQTLEPPQARAMFEQTALILDAKNVPIGAVEDRKIDGPGGPIPVRIYTPQGAADGSGKLPVIVYFHGGGFVIGSLGTHDAVCRLMANKIGCKVVAVDYRLAPEHKFPAAVFDCCAAVQWVAANADELGVDVNRLAVAGDSAGGNLAAVISILARDAGNKPAIAFQLLIYPATDAITAYPSREEVGKGYFLETELMDWFFAHYGNSKDDRSDIRFSPLLADSHAGLPPAYVITAGFDPLRDEGKAYADKLKAAGVPVTYVNYEGMIHGFWNMSGVIEKAREAIVDACAAVAKALSAND